MEPRNVRMIGGVADGRFHVIRNGETFVRIRKPMKQPDSLPPDDPDPVAVDDEVYTLRRLCVGGGSLHDAPDEIVYLAPAGWSNAQAIRHMLQEWRVRPAADFPVRNARPRE